MSFLRLQVLALLLVAACGASQRPQLKVLGIEQGERTAPSDGGQAAGGSHTIKLFVEVTNYARHPMHLERLEYQFGPSGSVADAAHGQISLSRTVDAGSAVVVEVPILVGPDLLLDAHDLELRGELITEQDQILRAYPVKSAVE